VFSIYSVGVVKGYKRETRVKIQSVVDFRSAPSLANLTAGAASAAAAPAASASASSASAGLGSIAGALQPSIGGQVLYFNIQ
jgi:hypothetical protein